MSNEINNTLMTITLTQMAQVFEAWETGYRANPSIFLSDEECAAASVDRLSAERAAYFLELLIRHVNTSYQQSDELVMATMQRYTTGDLSVVAIQPARQPLTDEQLADLMPEDDTPMSLGQAFVTFARAIEAAHGITKATGGAA